MPFPHFILGVLTALIWGTNFVAIKMSYEIFTPFWLVTTRFFLSFFPFILFLPRPKTPWTKLLTIAIVMWLGQFLFTFCAIYQGVPAGLAAVLLQINVMLTALLSWIFFKQKLTKRGLLSLVISGTSIILIAVQMTSSSNWLGYLFVLLAAICIAVGNLSLKTSPNENIFSVITWSSLLAFIPSFGLAFYFDGWPRFITICHSLTIKTCGSVLFTSYFSTIVANFMWVFLMRHYEATKVAPFTLLVPIFALTGSTFYLNEPMTLTLWIACLLVMGGLSLNYMGKRKDYTIKPIQPRKPFMKKV